MNTVKSPDDLITITTLTRREIDLIRVGMLMLTSVSSENKINQEVMRCTVDEIKEVVSKVYDAQFLQVCGGA